VTIIAPDPEGVFINCPFDASYEPIFVTLVGTLIFLGQKPHCVIEVREKGDGRLARIFELITGCRISIHDLSRVGTPARFNMPFELGLACSLKLTQPELYEVFVMDATAFRTDLTLSDYKGRDPLIHNGTCEGVISALIDTFQTEIDAAAISGAARLLRKSARLMKANQKVSSAFRPSVFRGVVAAATRIAVERGFIVA
jgi:hypothetical protein